MDSKIAFSSAWFHACAPHESRVPHYVRCALLTVVFQLHINLGLNKLKETQAGVEDMQKGLAQKERRLRYKLTPCRTNIVVLAVSARFASLSCCRGLSV